MSSKIKVLHFQLLPLLTGVQNVSLNEINFLKEKFDFEVACSYPGPFSNEISKMGLKTHFFEELKHTINIKSDTKVFFQLLRFFKLNNYDIVHTHSSKPGILGRITAKISGCKRVIHTVHGFAFGSTNNIVKKSIFFFLEFLAARFTDEILVMNKSDYKFCNKSLLIPKKKITFLSNGIQDELFFNFDKENRIVKSNQKFLNIVFVGRLSFQKNPKLLLEAFYNLPSEIKDIVKLYYIGDGELLKEMTKIVDEYKIGRAHV